MALDADVLKNLMVTNITNSSDPAPTNTAMVEAFAGAIASAIVQHFTSAAVVTIPTNAIATAGSSTNQQGPTAPVDLSIT